MPRPTDRASRWPRLARAAPLAIFALASAGCAYWTLQVRDWTVMTDELQYVKLAQAIGDDWSLTPRLHGAYYGSNSQLYPLLIAPFVSLLDMPEAFRVIHVFNALLMASACFPAYLLARLVVHSRTAALIAAACSVAVPWMALSAVIVTELAAYPAFIWAIWAIQRALTRPSIGRDAVALAAIAVATAARTQFVFLLAAFPLAVVGHELGWALIESGGERLGHRLGRALRRTVTGHAVLVVLVAAAALALALPQARVLLVGALGNYTVVLRGVLPAGIGVTMLRHVDVLALAVGVLPFVLTLAFVVSALSHAENRERHAFAVLTLVSLASLVFITGSFVTRFFEAGWTVDRYLFYVAPLLFVGMVAALTGRRRPVLTVMLGGLVFSVLASLTPFVLPAVVSVHGSPASTAHVVLDGRAQQLGTVFGLADLPPEPFIAVGGLLAALAAALANRGRAGRAPLVAVGLAVLVFCAAETGYAFHTTLRHQIGAGPEFAMPLDRRSWIDEAVPDGTSVALLTVLPFDVFTSWRVWWEVEFWNKSVDRAYLAEGGGSSTPFGTDRTIKASARTGRIVVKERPGTTGTPYLVVGPFESRFRLASTTVAEARGGVKLLRAELPYRAEWVSVGLASDGWIDAARLVRVRLFPGRDGRPRATRVTFGFDLPAYTPRPVRYEIEGGNAPIGGALNAVERERATVEACVPGDGTLDLVVRGRGGVALPDGRRPAVHLRSIDSEPAGRRC